MDESRRNLQLEARAHIRLQESIDLAYAGSSPPEPVASEFLQSLHREFYRDAPGAMLEVSGVSRSFMMELGRFRCTTEEDVSVGRHVPPGSAAVTEFMRYFSSPYSFSRLSPAQRILALPAAHHRFNYIHPFPDGNGRVSRLMSHAMALQAGIGAHGLWSISRGLARGIESAGEYKRMMDDADSPRRGDLDGRGNLSLEALVEYSTWYLKVCLDQVRFMAALFDIDGLFDRLRRFVSITGVRGEGARLLIEILDRGEIARGDVPVITGLRERTARTLLADLLKFGILDSASDKGAVFLRFPVEYRDVLFPRLFPDA